MPLFRALTLACILLNVPAFAAEKPNRKGLDFFEAKIRPVLVESCYQCHSAQAAASGDLKAKLQLDTRDGVLQGGDSGPAVIPGKPEESLLISALKHESFEMPPKGKLPAGVINDFVKWVQMGAPDPREGEVITTAKTDIEAGRQFWSFQPLHNVVPPSPQNNAWGRNPIDQFILARQEQKGLTPNPVAPPEVLIRRAYYDLTGLPPTPEEVEQFVLEAEKDLDSAYAALIDRLLASEHYGERWGRHWLDLARFAESNGYAFDLDRPNAWHYRDFVIKALNENMPYDEFVRLQLAGDLLQPNDYMATAATGFLVAGPFTSQQTAKERERSRYEQLDDMLHTTGSSLLGLTIGCCRCHDHKFDPLPAQDYYRMAACFAEVGSNNLGLDLHPEVYREAKAKFDTEIQPLLNARSRYEAEQLPGQFEIWLANREGEVPAPQIGNWHHTGPFSAANFDVAYAMAYPPEKKIDLTETFQEGKLKWTEQPEWKDGTVHNTLTGENSANYLFRVIESPVARKIELSLGSDDAIRVWVNGTEILNKKVARGAAPDQEKVDLPLIKGRNELLMKIVNGGGPSGFYFQSSLGGPPPEVIAILETPAEQWNVEQRQKAMDWYKTLDEGWVKLNAAVEEKRKNEPQPDLTMIFAAQTRGTTYQFGENTYKVFFLSRGNPDNKQAQASPGFLQVLMAPEEEASHWLQDAEQALVPSRIALANWITDTEQGAGDLLARVMVNRLWQHHLGRGIVSTPSDFGTRGEQPTHPELLDWLAAELIRNDWQLKSIHRLIMTSSVYMQGNEVTAKEQQIDPDNLLLWRRESRRLEAEIIRDALLSVSGTLDKTQFGVGTLDERSPRRSIYLTVKRSRILPFLQLFDAPDAMQSIGNRQESTVAPQALAMMNSPLVRELAGKFANRIRPQNGTTPEQAIDHAYLIALSRHARPEEVSFMQKFIESQTQVRGGNPQAEQAAWQDFCQVLLCMNEFIYVD